MHTVNLKVPSILFSNLLALILRTDVAIQYLGDKDTDSGRCPDKTYINRIRNIGQDALCSCTGSPWGGTMIMSRLGLISSIALQQGGLAWCGFY